MFLEEVLARLERWEARDGLAADSDFRPMLLELRRSFREMVAAGHDLLSLPPLRPAPRPPQPEQADAPHEEPEGPEQ